MKQYMFDLGRKRYLKYTNKYESSNGTLPRRSLSRENQLRPSRTIIRHEKDPRNPWCSRRRRIDEADISTSVAVDQRTAKCLEEAVRSFTVMGSRCRSSRADVTFHRPLPVFRVARCSSVHCFQTASMWKGSTAHELLLRDRKILLFEGR
ncbi:uncharacterized protein TNCV_4107891 [Trichonephila clavipes]|nr:uncharacterized protein TNCV_4107891 [Trichonephila clavipes]